MATNPKIFLSYRREDSAEETARILKTLETVFGPQAVFMDTRSIEAGSNWPQRVATAINGAQVVLTVIGPDWLRVGSNQWGQRRIESPGDWVRKELTAAKAQGTLVIPVLVRGSTIPPADALPKPLRWLSTRQAIELTRESWAQDAVGLVSRIREVIPMIKPDVPPRLNRGLNVDELNEILTTLPRWGIVRTENGDGTSRTELHRSFMFKTPHDVVRFVSEASIECSLAQHLPRWEIMWRSLKVFLTTWDLGNVVSTIDVDFARYFDRAYVEFMKTGPRQLAR